MRRCPGSSVGCWRQVFPTSRLAFLGREALCEREQDVGDIGGIAGEHSVVETALDSPDIVSRTFAPAARSSGPGSKSTTITMDDGKANVMSLPMQHALHDALDRTVTDNAVVLLRGRPGVFSGGFDLATLAGGGADALEVVRGGFDCRSAFSSTRCRSSLRAPVTRSRWVRFSSCRVTTGSG